MGLHLLLLCQNDPLRHGRFSQRCSAALQPGAWAVPSYLHLGRGTLSPPLASVGRIPPRPYWNPRLAHHELLVE